MSHRIKVLFVCSHNKWRSRTAETIFQRSSLYDARSVGTDSGARIRITGGDIGWAQWIFFMEKKHVEIVKSKYRDFLKGKNLACLNIEDRYRYMDPQLVELLESKLSAFLEI